MFKNAKEAVQKRFDELTKDETFIFYKDVDRDKIWEIYLNAFSEEVRQGYNCNCCKSFLRQFSGIVFIKDHVAESIWDIDLTEVDDDLVDSLKAIKKYIDSLPITNVFLTHTKKMGTDKNLDSIKNTIWEHFSIKAENIKIIKEVDIPSKLSELRSAKEVLKRGLEELTIDAFEVTLDLIAQNSLYRGKEFESAVEGFYKLKKRYNLLKANQKDAFAWLTSVTVPNLSGIRNTAIGTLLINLSEGMELDTAVRKYEAVVAPTNYKRPTALITQRMIYEAKIKIQELGFIDSLERRFANSTDINVNDLIFIDKSSELTDIFNDIQKEVLVNPKTLSKVEEMGIKDFIEKVVPTSKSIELLLEPKHFPNFFSLLTVENPQAPSMFKWNNPFSWAYTGGITDSIKERVKSHGGSVEGELRVSLSWFNYDDLDLHVQEPNGNKIYFSAKQSPYSGGFLDVDMNAGSGTSRQAVENIIFKDKNRMAYGKYRVIVNNYNKRETSNQGYIIEVECQGNIYTFEQAKSPANGVYELVVELEYSKTKGLTINGESNQKVVSKEKWNIKTNQYIKVKSIMLSPNHWGDKPTGNKHFLFTLEGCQNDEQVRPFFNEFLKQELNDHRKVFEIMAGKLKVPTTTNQLSGVGFSETQENEINVRLTGSFKRNIKIKF